MTAVKMSEDARTARDGIFRSSNRTYGETYIEPLIRAKFGLVPSGTGSFDAFSADKKIKYEIKSSKVLREKKEVEATTLFDVIAAAKQTDDLDRLIPTAECETAEYVANIQNVKRDDFDILIYVLLFEDAIKVFMIPSSKINADNVPNWSDKHGRYDEFGKSGQFPIKAANIKVHISNYAKTTLTWDEAARIFKELAPNGEKHDKPEQIEKRKAC